MASGTSAMLKAANKLVTHAAESRGCGVRACLLYDRRQALTADVHGIAIAIAVWVNTLTRLKRGEPWYEIGIDAPDRRCDRYPEPVGR
ncbi:hypothetical protein ACFWBR_41880 [Streptomyces sp. NPDC060006]|uniref:hypothetical protein n=1 Tax=unclassified Streptomyces TaxID=2593676 RepID=UPI0036363734